MARIPRTRKSGIPPPAVARFEAAFGAHQAGRLAEAEEGYRQVLSLDARHADALHLLGVVHMQKRDLKEAEILIRQALAIREEPSMFGNLGTVLKQTRRLSEAEEVYRRALELKPDYVDAYNNLGNVLKETHRLLEAEAAYRRALELKPDFAEAHNNLGIVLHEINRLLEAESAYRRAFELKPNYADAYYNLGNLLRHTHRLPEAEIAYHRALELRPQYAEAHNNLGNLLAEIKRASEAEAAYRRALELKPDYAEACNNLGNLFKESGRTPEAEAAYRRALELKPDYVEAHNNLGILLQEARRFPEAEAAYRRTLELNPDYADACCSLGNLFQETQRLPEAEAAYRRAIELKADHADARWNLGLLLLSLGRWREAWPYYEARYDPSKKEVVARIPDFPYPRWQGEPVAGKSIVILPEQGLGDQIQFCRYLSVLKSQGAHRITLVCDAPLKTLFERFAGADEVLTSAAAEDVPIHDYWTFLGSIPLHCGFTPDNVPATVPYLTADPRRRHDVAAQFADIPGLKVGVCWQGSKTYKRDAERSPGIEPYRTLFHIAGARFVTLQSGNRDAFLAAAGDAALDLGHEIDALTPPFEETAAVIMNLDLVISSDTSIAHLAGALGRPVWIVLPFRADWRWLMDREDCPWYPNGRLFRQASQGDWKEVFDRVALRLKGVVARESPALLR